MNRVQYLLVKLAEEAAEISQIALKSAQFGLEEVYQVDSNKERLYAELNDLLGVLAMLEVEGVIRYVPSPLAMEAKAEKVEKYYQYSVGLGMIHE